MCRDAVGIYSWMGFVNEHNVILNDFIVNLPTSIMYETISFAPFPSFFS